MVRVGAAPSTGGGEAAMLGGHVPEEVGESPTGAGGGPSQILRPDAADDVDGLLYRPAIEFSDVQLNRSHAHIIGICIRYVDAYSSTVSEPRPDLAALIEPIRAALIDLENDVLGRHGLSMWAYVVLLNLTEQPVRTQAALADAIRADRSRIIGVLDDLQERGLIDRRPDPDDRRVRLLALTASGLRLRSTAQAAIQAREEHLLAVLPARARAEFLKSLRLLGDGQALARLRAQDPASGQAASGPLPG